MIHNLLRDQDHLSDALQLETLIRNVMYGERRYTIDIEERGPLLDALMDSKPYELKPNEVISPKLGRTLRSFNSVRALSWATSGKR